MLKRFVCKSRKVQVLAICLLLVMAGCAGSLPSGDGQPQSSDVANFASNWLTGLTSSIAQNAPAAISTLCASGAMSSEECGYAALGQSLLPAFVGVAQSALTNFKAQPTAENQKALDTAMAPVYTAAKTLGGGATPAAP